MQRPSIVLAGSSSFKKRTALRCTVALFVTFALAIAPWMALSLESSRHLEVQEAILDVSSVQGELTSLSIPDGKEVMARPCQFQAEDLLVALSHKVSLGCAASQRCADGGEVYCKVWIGSRGQDGQDSGNTTCPQSALQKVIFSSHEFLCRCCPFSGQIFHNNQNWFRVRNFEGGPLQVSSSLELLCMSDRVLCQGLSHVAHAKIDPSLSDKVSLTLSGTVKDVESEEILSEAPTLDFSQRLCMCVFVCIASYYAQSISSLLAPIL
mmetsp:Transcript_56067/g.121240  ORF Transcript_56067/g.121240 Transcript_56067/m.121240 type:complete len:266 (+) Transcript_56067:67-864(+)